MTKRKTFKVNELIDIVNRRNKESTCDKKVREGWNSMLEEILHLTNQYNGFIYLDENEVPVNCLPAINIIVKNTEERFNNTDDTRRKYCKKYV